MKKPRNYAATDITRIQLAKTRRDVAALTKRVTAMERDKRTHNRELGLLLNRMLTRIAAVEPPT